ncbi:methyltransferase [Streptomyces sp. NPDC047002]|uniref:methyltransferase n=1 Tax=Streptomyces sp. NPDC047002 TaxID=3155475 RepID=UPI003455EEAB
MYKRPHTGTVPLTPVPLMEMAAGFRISKVLATALELNVFGTLNGSRGMEVAEFAEAVGLAERPAKMLLVGCTALGLLERTAEGYRNSRLADEFLIRGKRYYFGDFIRFNDRRAYSGWLHLEQALREDRPMTWDTAAASSVFEGDGMLKDMFWQALYSGAMFTARALALSVDLGPYRKLLDVGGGSGAFCIELTAHHPALSATVYDRAVVCELARQSVEDAGAGDRVEVIAGDFWQEDLPRGHDVMLLSNVLHDWSEEENLVLARKCHAALDEGGAVIVAEAFVDDDGTGPVSGAVSSLHMLLETSHGRNYSRAEYESLLRKAGFSDVSRVDFILDAPGANGALVARKI